MFAFIEMIYWHLMIYWRFFANQYFKENHVFIGWGRLHGININGIENLEDLPKLS